MSIVSHMKYATAQRLLHWSRGCSVSVVSPVQRPSAQHISTLWMSPKTATDKNSPASGGPTFGGKVFLPSLANRGSIAMSDTEGLSEEMPSLMIIGLMVWFS